MRKRICLVVGCVLAVLVIAAVSFLPKRHCILCGSRPYHGLCLVDLESGILAELQIYDYTRAVPWVVSKAQSGGYLALSWLGSARITRSPDEQVCTADVPEKDVEANRSRFCRSCREKLEGIRGFALADLYHPLAHAVWPVEEGEARTVRGYTVDVERQERSYHVTVRIHETASESGI